MTPDQIDLARRAVADPRWRWEPGMLLTEPGIGSGRVVYRGDPRLSVAWRTGSIWQPVPADWSAYFPDLTDPATAGVILSWLPSGLRIETMLGRVAIWYHGDPPPRIWRGSCLGEAAVRAWLALGEGR